MAKECNQQANLDQCTCTYEPCSRKGLCWPEVERTYDRSFQRFVRVYSR
jgi:hypothetical protein